MKDSNINETKQQKILRRSKWKARLQTAFSALGIILLFTIISSFLTAGYYSWGTPDRADVFRNIIDQTLTVTNPYGYLGGTSTNTSPFFGLEAVRDLNKTIGNETVKVGEVEGKVFFLNDVLSRTGIFRKCIKIILRLFHILGRRAECIRLEEIRATS